MVADAHATVVVEQLQAVNLEKLVITLSSVPLPAITQWPQTSTADPRTSPEPPSSHTGGLLSQQPCQLRTAEHREEGHRNQPAVQSTGEPQRKQKGIVASSADAAIAPSASGAAQLRSTLRRSLILAVAIVTWYTANIGLILTNRRAAFSSAFLDCV